MFNVLKTKNVTLNTKLLNMLQKTLDRKTIFEDGERSPSKRRKRDSVPQNDLTDSISFEVLSFGGCWVAGRASPIYFYVLVNFF